MAVPLVRVVAAKVPWHKEIYYSYLKTRNGNLGVYLPSFLVYSSFIFLGILL